MTRLSNLIKVLETYFYNNDNSDKIMESIIKTKNLTEISAIFSKYNINVPGNFLSLFSTMEVIINLNKELSKKNTDFGMYLSGYLLENEFD